MLTPFLIEVDDLVDKVDVGEATTSGLIWVLVEPPQFALQSQQQGLRLEIDMLPDLFSVEAIDLKLVQRSHGEEGSSRGERVERVSFKCLGRRSEEGLDVVVVEVEDSMGFEG